jgi:hypothetical protein
MDYTNTDFWIAIGVGGSIVAAMSTAQQLLYKNEYEAYSGFKAKPVIRDFCLGAFLTAVLYMFLPETFGGWISSVQGAASTAASSVSKGVSSMSGGSSNTSAFGDYDLQVGPARF